MSKFLNYVFMSLKIVKIIFNSIFFKKFLNTIRVSTDLTPDQDQCSVRLDLGLNCLQRLSADDKSHP